MKISKMIQMGVAALLLSGAAVADSVDLIAGGWIANGAGSWNIQGAGNDSVKQTLNNGSTIFHNDKDSQGLALSGTIKVATTSDDDFIGFVLGYNDDDLNNNAADYILIDWKQGDQNLYSGPGIGNKGLSISRVEGALGTAYTKDAWDHVDKVTELQRATTLGSVGWADNTTYTFDLIFTATLIEVFVNGAKELSLAGSFNNGSFGFYNYSQPNVLYAGIEENIAPAVPVPAALFMFAPALLGFMGLRRKAKAKLA